MDASRRTRLSLLAAFVAVLSIAPAGVAAAVTDDAAEATEPPPASTASLSLSVTPHIGEEPEGGDLVLDEATGLATLTFSPGRAEQQRAVLDFEVVNTGDVTLEDVAVEAERLGTVLAADAGTVLAPGERTTVRGVLEVTGAEARKGFAGIVELPATVTATAGDDVVAADAVGLLQVVAVLAAPTATVSLEAVVGDGDVTGGPGGLPTVTWSEEDVAAEVVREVHYRLSVSNTGTVGLVDVVGTVDLLGMVTEVSVAEVLAPGEDAVVDVMLGLRPEDVTGVGTEGPAEAELTATVTVTGTDADGIQPLSASADAVVLGVVVRPLPEEVVLPVAGPPTRGDLGLLAVLSIGLGVALLTAAPRRRIA